MLKNKIVISGTGCALADFLYTKISFASKAFQDYASKKAGDGGLSPGRLVFVEELERFAGELYPFILSEITNRETFNAFNIGGPALVSLIHASQLLPASGFDVNFYGCTGDDDTGRLIRSFLRRTRLGLDHYITLHNRKTPFTDVLSDLSYGNGQGERSFISNIGCAWNYLPEMLPGSFFNSDIVCFGGTALVPNLHDHLTSLLQRAKSSGSLTVVNTVFDFRNERMNPGKPWPLGTTSESLKLTDMLIMDCEEAIKISGQQSIEQAALYFSEQSYSAFIITNGSKALFAYSNGSVFKPMKLSQFPVSSAIVAELGNRAPGVGDTTGCGDNFAGGIVASMACQLARYQPGDFDLKEALAWGVASGGFACFYLGGTYNEQKTGEKSEQIRRYKTAYLKQINGHGL